MDPDLNRLRDQLRDGVRPRGPAVRDSYNQRAARHIGRRLGDDQADRAAAEEAHRRAVHALEAEERAKRVGKGILGAILFGVAGGILGIIPAGIIGTILNLINYHKFDSGGAFDFYATWTWAIIILISTAIGFLLLSRR